MPLQNPPSFPRRRESIGKPNLEDWESGHIIVVPLSFAKVSLTAEDQSLSQCQALGSEGENDAPASSRHCGLDPQSRGVARDVREQDNTINIVTSLRT